ncbi:MAG: carbamoyltransferase C-terminal domain-containing protein [Candidatus Sumerlaeia bacterium]
MRIIGIHDGHNAAACLVEDGVVRAALQEERLTRIKNHDTFPKRAVEWLLAEAGCGWGGIDAVAMNGFHMPVHRDRERLIRDTRLGGSRKPARMIRRIGRSFGPVLDSWKARRREEREAEARAAGVDISRIVYIEHHRCHAEAAYWGSPFRGEPVLVMTADGAGDDLCATVSTVDENGVMTRIAQVDESASPAMVYLAVTTLLGMVPNEHEYKLMGMAPYGSAKGAEAVYKIFEKMFEWDPVQPLGWRRRRGIPNTYYCYDWLRRKLELKRFDIVCAGLQLWIERMLGEWVGWAIAETDIRKVALSGGIFMNVKANQVIAESLGVKDLFIFPSCGDETNAIGAAYAVYNERRKPSEPPVQPLGPIYWGPETKAADIEAALHAAASDFTFSRPENMAAHAAGFLARGEVVARFEGRAEFGARALGNRSILANPSDHKVIKRINEMIKCRDFWMPFACSILAEREHDYIVNPKRIAAPYMILTFAATGRVNEIEAGTHPYDNTVRPQILRRDWNPGYWDLIRAFEERTGIGAVLNTSFNLHGHPIVNSPAEALDVMRRSGLQYLILGPWWVEKKVA